jgi:nitrogen fixation protein NifU and related proteins
MDYSGRVLEYFENPENSGSLPEAHGVGTVGNPACGDIIKVYISVEGGRISDVKYKTMGCAAAIACSESMARLVKGKSLEELLPEGKTREEAVEILREAILSDLGGLPSLKTHCSMLAMDGFYNAINDYLGGGEDEK